MTTKPNIRVLSAISRIRTASRVTHVSLLATLQRDQEFLVLDEQTREEIRWTCRKLEERELTDYEASLVVWAEKFIGEW